MPLMFKRFAIIVIVGLLTIGGFAAHVFYAFDFPLWSRPYVVALASLMRGGDMRFASSLGLLAAWWAIGGAFLGVLSALILVRPKADYGSARWGGFADAKEHGFSSRTGIVLGRVRRSILRQNLLATLVIGPPRTGKSTSVIIPTILDLGKTSAFVHDLKGELARITGGARAAVGRVVVMNPLSAKTARWNPLASSELPSDDASLGDLVDSYWMALIPESANPSGNQKHFEGGGRAFGRAATLYEIYRARTEGREALMVNVLRWISGIAEAAQSSDEMDAVVERLQTAIDDVKTNGYPERIALAFGRIISASGEERGSLISTATGALDPWLNERVVHLTSACDFSVSDYRKDGSTITVFWVCPPLSAAVYAGAVGMHIEAAVRALTTTYREGMREVMMVLDEAKFLPPLKVISESPAVVLGYGVRMLVAVQDQAQLVERYGRTTYDAMIGCYGTRVVFSQNNLNTATEISRTIGRSSRVVGSMSSRGVDMSSTSDSMRGEGFDLINPSDVMSIKRGYVLVLQQYAMSRPLKVRAAYYKKIGRYKRLAGRTLPADVSAALNP